MHLRPSDAAQLRRFPAELILSMVACCLLPFDTAAQPTRQEVGDAMQRATDFMLNEVSNRGGFLAHYTADLSEGWGEIPARPSMIWVQDPGTITVGRLFLTIYQKTGDPYYLEALQRVCNALMFGQRPEGGWHYFIDFDPDGIEEWYAQIGAKAWGWEEFYHFDDNSTFDDSVTAAATDLLLDVYLNTLDPACKGALFKALDFILESQYPIGAWPQRYPLRPGYTSCYTFNDGVITNNIDLLWKAYHRLGNEEYRESALRGMFFVLLSQGSSPQAGWAQAFDSDLIPAGARSYEPKAWTTSTTVANIAALEKFYRMTGDRRFLRGIPEAILWLERSVLPPEISEKGCTHAEFVEIGTNRPLFAHREGTSVEDGRYWVDYQSGNFPDHYGMQTTVDTQSLRREYERIDSLSPDEARAELKAEEQAPKPDSPVEDREIAELISSLDARGAWVEHLSLPDTTDWKYKPRREFQGISTRTYVNNMKKLLAHLQHQGPSTKSREP